MTEMYRPFNEELSPSQIKHWEDVKERAEIQLALAKRMLGIKAVEETVEVKK